VEKNGNGVRFQELGVGAKIVAYKLLIGTVVAVTDDKLASDIRWPIT